MSHIEAVSSNCTFEGLQLISPVLESLKDSGYSVPSPIQEQAIPFLLRGQDLVGQAQTGTGKTAAYALPLISRLDMSIKAPQVLVLTPTRELGIQVAESFKKYASHVPGFQVLPIYGGQSYEIQLRQLKKGPMVVVGTPGRVMDHIRRKTLSLDTIQTLVLDEADEMLKMGFIEDVEWILEQTPEHHQICLFSATMPPQIRKIAQKYLNKPQEVTIKSKTSTVKSIRQRFCITSAREKDIALLRFLEVEPVEAGIVFVKTKAQTLVIEEILKKAGHSCAALNGDIAQNQREKIVQRLRSGSINIIIATDVAARGLDIERLSHVFNYDIPTDTEAYVHRIGRTGRAGRDGEAILFVTKNERRLLSSIEKATRQSLELCSIPTKEEILSKKRAQFKDKVRQILDSEVSQESLGFIHEIEKETSKPVTEICAAFLTLLGKKSPLELDKTIQDLPKISQKEFDPAGRKQNSGSGRRSSASANALRIEVGRVHGVKPGSIVGATTNETGISSEVIGRIEILDSHSIVDFDIEVSKDVLQVLQKTWVAGQALKASLVNSSDFSSPGHKRRRNRPGRNRKSFDSRSKSRKGRSRSTIN